MTEELPRGLGRVECTGKDRAPGISLNHEASLHRRLDEGTFSCCGHRHGCFPTETRPTLLGFIGHLFDRKYERSSARMAGSSRRD